MAKTIKDSVKPVLNILALIVCILFVAILLFEFVMVIGEGVHGTTDSELWYQSPLFWGAIKIGFCVLGIILSLQMVKRIHLLFSSGEQKRQLLEVQLEYSKKMFQKELKENETQKLEFLALKKSEEKYRSILENIVDSYFELDLKGAVVFFNKSLPGFMGYTREELQEVHYKKLACPEDLDKLRMAFNNVYVTGKTSPLIQCRFITKDNVKKDIGIIASLLKNKKGEAIGFQGLARDVTQQKLMENSLKHTQKMEAIGNLAGGVAHDFNNILSGIIGSAQLIKKHSAQESSVQPYVEQIMKASKRATGLVKQILLFSRKTESEKIPSDMQQIAQEVIKLLRASIPSTIEIKSEFKENLLPILADQTQMHQVFMNLCSNAAHAMKDDGGCLELILTDATVTQKVQKGIDQILPGDYIKLSVSDTGKGMDQQTVDKIFDPYFTTKEIGSGTGLGLATVHGIVKDHNGHIQVESKIGNGTVFNIFFPATHHTIKQIQEPVEMVNGNETILFVDDEVYLADVGKEMLEDYGYSVEAVTNSPEALELFEQHPDKYDLVITDNTMPKMTGEQLARNIHKINPDVPIIMCTGISLDPESINGFELERVLMKPLDMSQMLKNVREVIDLSRK